MTIWQFAGEHYIVAIVLAWIAAHLAATPFRFAFLAYNRYCRTKNIAAKGWPPEHLDADGDFKETE